jgi:hypothetical protein
MKPATESPRLVLVTGSGRSGTSTIAGVLKYLGLRIPQPEVPGNRSNPKGHFEPKWVVDFQQRLLNRTRVKLTDARPEAFQDTAKAGLRPAVQEELRQWLAPQFDGTGDLLVKDPRNTWFVPMWKQCADDLGVDMVSLTMLRHPAEVVGSKNAYYYRKESPERRRVGETSRVASWVNVALFGEAATRGQTRSFIRYTDLLSDWRPNVERAAQELGLSIAEGFPVEGAAAVDDFIDPDLHRIKVTWDDLDIPPALQDLAEEVWTQSDRLVTTGGHDEAAEAALDEARATYEQMYSDAFALAGSSVDAAVNSALRKQRRQMREDAAKEATSRQTQPAVLGKVTGKARGAARRVRARLKS